MRVKFLVTLLSAALAAHMLSSCGEASGGSRRGSLMKLPECGIEMNAPPGWKIDGPGVCSNGDSTGLFLSEPLEGKNFSDKAEEMSREFGAKIESRTDCTVAGRKTLRILSEAPNGMKVLRLYMDFGENIAYVSYVTLKEDFPACEAELQKSLDSVRSK